MHQTNNPPSPTSHLLPGGSTITLSPCSPSTRLEEVRPPSTVERPPSSALEKVEEQEEGLHLSLMEKAMLILIWLYSILYTCLR